MLAIVTTPTEEMVIPETAVPSELLSIVHVLAPAEPPVEVNVLVAAVP